MSIRVRSAQLALSTGLLRRITNSLKINSYKIEPTQELQISDYEP